MKALYDLKEKLCMELEEIAAKPSLSTGDLETLHKLTDTIKNIDKIAMLEGGEEGYSRAGGWEARGNYGNRRYDEGGSSYRGMHYVRGHYSRDDIKQHMIGELERMMGTADGQYREVIQRALDEVRRD